MKFVNHIGHYCIKGARLNVHRPPETLTCGNAACAQGISGEHKFHVTIETAKKAGISLENPRCPNCDGEMVHSGPTHFAELHLEICLDEFTHYREWRQSGRMTDQAYKEWQSTLSERELNGYFDVRTHHTAVRLEPHEVDLFESDPKALVESIRPKIEARLELDAQFQIQHRSTVKQHDLRHLFKDYWQTSSR